MTDRDSMPPEYSVMEPEDHGEVEPRWPGHEHHPEEGGPEQSGGLNLRTLLLALRRRYWLVLVFAVVGVAGAAGAWRMVAPEYVAQGALWVQSQDQASSSSGPIRSEGLLRSSAWVDLLRSFAVLDTVVIREKLFIEPGNPADSDLFREFGLADEFVGGRYRLQVDPRERTYALYREDVVVGRGQVGDSVGSSYGFHWQPSTERLLESSSLQFTVLRPRDAARRLADRLTTRMDPLGTFIRLELRGRDADRIASVLNTLMERHVELAADLKRGNLDERTEILQEQLDYVEDELRQAERALEDFRVRTITLPSDESAPIAPGLEITRDPVFANFFDMRVELEQIRRDRQRLEESLNRIPERGIRVPALELIPSVRSADELVRGLAQLTTLRENRRALLTEYTEEHPPVQQLTERIRALERDALPRALMALTDELRSREAELEDRIDSVSSDLSEIPTRSIEEARLTRRVEIAENLFTELRQRFEQARLAAASSIPDVRILDQASVPQVPTDDERLRFALVILAAAVGSGAGLAVLLQVLDQRVRFPSEIPGRMGLSILGTVPPIQGPTSDVADGDSPTFGQSADQYAVEAFRDIRMNLGYAYGSAGPIGVAISSPGAGEGKSLVTTNLALSFAELGRRTLLVDGDLRRGNLHEFLGSSRKPGLTDFLAGDAKADRILRRTAFDNLYLIPSGSRMTSAPELLGSESLTRLFSAARERFDVILVDTPPMGAGSDAFILAAAMGHLAVILRSGKTERDVAMARLETLRRLPVRLLGAILNDFRGNDLYGSYVSGYISGYEPRSEEDAAPAGLDGDGDGDGGETVEAIDERPEESPAAVEA